MVVKNGYAIRAEKLKNRNTSESEKPKIPKDKLKHFVHLFDYIAKSTGSINSALKYTKINARTWYTDVLKENKLTVGEAEKIVKAYKKLKKDKHGAN